MRRSRSDARASLQTVGVRGAVEGHGSNVPLVHTTFACCAPGERIWFREGCVVTVVVHVRGIWIPAALPIWTLHSKLFAPPRELKRRCDEDVEPAR
jgi:hypothetical protein